MPLSMFIDALPYNEIKSKYPSWFENMQVAELLPNVGYSSSLHWQLYCDKYPDERGVFVDWVKEPESNTGIRLISKLLAPLDKVGDLGLLSRKVMNRIVFRKNVFANIPYRFRGMFSEKGQYLFWNKNTYNREPIFEGYSVISQDEGHLTFDAVMGKVRNAISSGEKNLFVVLGFADAEGHVCRRGDLYDQRLKPYMDNVHDIISEYLKLHPEEEVLIVSDHGMSTVEHHIDVGLEKKFGKPGKNSYIAYSDTAIMCIWVDDKVLRKEISDYLTTFENGHLLNDIDRKRFGITDRKFGDLIFNLREGYVFSNNWFGKSIKKPRPEGAGMHGFWPERCAHDQMASVLLINSSRRINDTYEYKDANKLIVDVMQGKRVE